MPKLQKNVIAPLRKIPIGKLRDDERIDGLEIAHAIFNLRKRGFGDYEISKELKLPIRRVRELQDKYRRALFADLGDLVTRERELALARLEDVLKNANAIAATDPDNEIKLKAGDQIIRAINSVCKVAGIEKPDPATKSVNDNFLWLNHEMPFVEKLVAGTPRELPENKADEILDLSFDDV